MWRDALRGGPWASLRVKLVAVALCLLAAGAAVILTVGASALRGQLIRQAGGQLRAYAYQLDGQSFQLLGTAQSAPATIVPFDGLGTGGEARAPGTSDRVGAASPASTPDATRAKGATAATGASSTPVAVVGGIAGPPGFSIELRGPGGQVLLSAGPGTQGGLALPKAFAPVPARTGVLRTVAGAGGSYLVMAEPVQFTARRLVFAYGANDFAITGRARTGQRGQAGRTGHAGQAGTLVVGLQLAHIYQPAGRLTLLAVAVSAAAILLVGGLSWAAIRFSLRPVTRAALTADAVAAGDLSQRVPDRLGGSLASSLNSMLSQLEPRFTGTDEAEAAARSATDQMSLRVLSVARELRRPVSLLHALADYCRRADRRGAADLDRVMDQVATAAARAESLVRDLE